MIFSLHFGNQINNKPRLLKIYTSLNQTSTLIVDNYQSVQDIILYLLEKMDIEEKYAQAFGITYRIGNSDIYLINSIQDILQLTGQNAVFALQIICYPSKNEFKQCQPQFLQILQEQIHARMLADALIAQYEQLLILASIECVILFSQKNKDISQKQMQKIVETHLNLLFPQVHRKPSQTKTIINDITEHWEESNDIILSNCNSPYYQYINYCVNHNIFNALLLEFELDKNIIGFNNTDFYVMNQNYKIQFQSTVQQVQLTQDNTIINVIGSNDRLQLPCNFKTQVIYFFNKIKVEKFRFIDNIKQNKIIQNYDNEDEYIFQNLSSLSSLNSSLKKSYDEVDKPSKLRLCQNYDSTDSEESNLET